MSAEYAMKLKKSVSGDEYYSSVETVNMILPYIIRGGYKKVWCPFDKDDSNFVKILTKEGFDVNYGHIETGQDFFEYTTAQGEVIVSNPPFSKRDQVFEKLYELKTPFAMVMNFNGLFDSRKRYDLFSTHNVQLLIPRGRMKFEHKDRGLLESPSFQSVYVCSGFNLDSQIVFTNDVF